MIFWKKIIEKCSDDERNQIKAWFEQHMHDGTVIDYMEDVLEEFVENEFCDEESLAQDLQWIDERIEQCGNATKCASTYSIIGGYKEDVLLRIELMEKHGATKNEISEYQKTHWNFTVIRNQAFRTAIESGKLDQAIAILEESKKLDEGDEYLLHTYSQNLIALYHDMGEHDKEIEERYYDLVKSQYTGINEYRELKKACTSEEWQKKRMRIISTKSDINLRCEMLADEKLISLLYKTVADSKSIDLLNKYGFLFVEDYSTEILETYKSYVIRLAEDACNRRRYEELTGYLRRMKKYKGGNKIINELVRDWTGQYATRKVMVDELQKVL